MSFSFKNVIPSRLHRVKTFLSYKRYEPSGGGSKILDVGPSLEAQIDRWIEETGCLIVGVGAINMAATQINQTITETQSLAVIYASPTEELSNEKFGERQAQESAFGPGGGETQNQGNNADRRVTGPLTETDIAIIDGSF